MQFLDNFMYPVFVTDSSDDAYEKIASLPGQARLGVKELISHLKPLVTGEDCMPLKGKHILSLHILIHDQCSF